MHQPQARDARPLAAPPFLLFPSSVPRLHPPTSPLTVPHFKCFSCRDAPLVLSLCFSLTLPTQSTSSLFHSLFLSVSALHLTWRESCGHNITLPLGPASDLFSAQSLFPRLHWPGEAKVEFASTSRSPWRDGHSLTHSPPHKNTHQESS